MTAPSAELAKRAMVNRKTDERTAIEAEMLKQGIHYQPMVASHFGSLHEVFDNWLTQLAIHCGRKFGWACRATERQIRGRLGAQLARRAARMSLATFGKDDGSSGVVLPLVDYDDLDRTTAHGLESQGVVIEEWDVDGGGAPEWTKLDRPAWDPGPQPKWGAAHGWSFVGGQQPTFGWDTRHANFRGTCVQTVAPTEAVFQ